LEVGEEDEEIEGRKRAGGEYEVEGHTKVESGNR
jgi:hypothetical protein